MTDAPEGVLQISNFRKLFGDPGKVAGNPGSTELLECTLEMPYRTSWMAIWLVRDFPGNVSSHKYKLIPEYEYQRLIISAKTPAARSQVS